jgi:hypothetical protein
MAQYSQHRDSSHFVVYVRYEPSVVVLYIKHNAIPNGVGILARSPDGGKIVSRRVHTFDDSDPRT